jgi:predicted negative regulator of RcsB-dependent stress response
MASSSVARKAKQTTIDSDDAVAMRAAEIAAWAQRNIVLVLSVAGVLAVVVAGTLYYQVYKSQRAERASTAYLTMQSTIPADTTAAIRQLGTFASNYDGTSEAAQSRMLIAQLWLAKGQPAKAVEEARKVAEGSSSLRDEGRLLLAGALAASNKREEAISTYLKLADDAKLPYMKQDALSQAAVLREQANDWKGAADLYRRMLDTTEKNSGDRTVVMLHLAEAEAHAGLPITAPQQ